VQAPAEQARRLYGPGRATFLRLSTSWSDQFQPRGSRALTWASLSTSRKLSSADCWVSNLPLIVGADQSPPGQGPGSQWSGAGPFHPKNPGRLTFFSRILTGEKYAAHTRGSQRRGRTRYAGDPCTCGRAEPPNLLLQFVGIPEVYAQQVYIEDIQIGVAVLAYDTQGVNERGAYAPLNRKPYPLRDSWQATGHIPERRGWNPPTCCGKHVAPAFVALQSANSYARWGARWRSPGWCWVHSSRPVARF